MVKESRLALNALKPWAKQKNNSGCGLAGLRRAHGVGEIAGSNPASPTKKEKTPCEDVPSPGDFNFITSYNLILIFLTVPPFLITLPSLVRWYLI